MPNPRLLVDEDFRADCRDAALFEGVHPILRRIHVKEPDEDQCAACGKWLLAKALTEDKLCAVCDEIVAELEQGIIS